MVRRSQRHDWLLFGVVASVVAGCGPLLGLDEQVRRLSGAGGAATVCGGECDDSNPCTLDQCDEVTASCKYIDRVDGPAPSDVQTAGDCQLVMCTDGVSLSVVDDQDLPDSAVCSEGRCVAGAADLAPLDEGTVCDVNGGNWCDGQGSCVECLDNDHCDTPTTCGGGGEPSVCGCTPRSCSSLGLTCGSGADNCGGVLYCDNGIVDGDETDVDCGGDAHGCVERCLATETCLLGSDCASGFCAGGACDGAWSAGYGDTGAQHARVVASDAFGNVILAGEFTGTVHFGGDPLTSLQGAWSSFIVKLDAQGHHLWSKKLSDVGVPAVTALAVDGSGNIVLAGSFVDTIDFGAGLMVGGPLPQGFVIKLDSAANPLWSVLLGAGPTSTSSSVATALALDATSKVIVGGQFNGDLDLGGVSMHSEGERDAFVVELNTAGDVGFARSFGHSGVQRINDVAIAPSGAIGIVGDFTQNIDFSGIGGAIHTSKGDWDIFITELDDAGMHDWSRAYGDSNPQTVAAVDIDDHGDWVVGGSFYGTLNLGAGVLPSTGAEDVFVARFDQSGNAIWSNGYGDTQAQHLVDLAIDSLGDIVVTGAFTSMIGFGSATLFSVGSNDVFVAKLDPQGGSVWSQRFGDAESQTSTSLAITPFNSIVVVGDFHGGIDFGQGLFQSAGGNDLFVAALAP